jgi:antitoxin component YwqK of YwqJK toxin-antitoxin module
MMKKVMKLNSRVLRNLISSLLVLISSLAFCQQDTLGFTDKKEATNQLVNGKKEGKWLEYKYDMTGTTTDTKAPYYMLTIYHNDKPVGVSRLYYKGTTNLAMETHYNNGLKTGMQTAYFYDGKTMQSQTFWRNDSIQGTDKEFYDSGKLYKETTYDKFGHPVKRVFYDKKGNVSDKPLDENGKKVR